MKRRLWWTLLAPLLTAQVAAGQTERWMYPPSGQPASTQQDQMGPYRGPSTQPYPPPAGWEADRYPSPGDGGNSPYPGPRIVNPQTYPPSTPVGGGSYPGSPQPSLPVYPGSRPPPNLSARQGYPNPQGYPASGGPVMGTYPPSDVPVTPAHPNQGRPSAAPPRAANAPFMLSPQEQAYLERVLQAWEQASSEVKRYRAKFVRWKYDDTFHRDKPLRDEGHVRYIAPDRGLYEIDADNGRPEKWICDGKTIYQFDFSQNLLIEYPMPPELQGQAITHGPLPFLFSSKAATLKKRYFLRVVTPPNVQGQIWLEAHPRYQVDAAEFQKAQIIINTKDMRPKAVQVYSPGGKERTVHEFYDVVVNDPLHFLQGDVGRPATPGGWNREVRGPAAGQAARPTPHQTRPQPGRW